MRIFLFFLLFTNVCNANLPADQIKEILERSNQKVTSVSQTHDKDVEILKKDYEFIFIFKSTCPHCHKFAPIIKDFSHTFGVAMNSYSFDGDRIEGLTSKPLTPDLYQSLFNQSGLKPMVPALFMKNKSTYEVYPVLFGEASPASLVMRLEKLLKHIEESHDA